MSTLPQSANPMTVAIARQLAAAHPNATLPCPLCPASVNAPNLERHLGKAHAAALGAGMGAGMASGPVRLSGIDRRIRTPMVGLLLGWLAVMGVVFGVVRVPLTDTSMAIAGATMIPVFVVVLAAFGDLFKARLELDGERLRLRWGLGLGTRTLRLPATIESGGLLEREDTQIGRNLEAGESELVDAGAYLQLSSGGVSITVGSAKAAGLANHWAPQGWSQGKKRQRWDIHVDPSALVAIQYHLAARGQLTPR